MPKLSTLKKMVFSGLKLLKIWISKGTPTVGDWPAGVLGHVARLLHLLHLLNNMFVNLVNLFMAQN